MVDEWEDRRMEVENWVLSVRRTWVRFWEADLRGDVDVVVDVVVVLVLVLARISQ